MPEDQNATVEAERKEALRNLKLASDEPYVSTGDDLFGRKDQVENLAHFIRTTPTPFTFAVYGQWGSGKTRFLQDVQRKLKIESTSERPITTVWFNLWEHQGDTDAAVAMVQCAIEELDPHWQKDRHLRQVLGQLISATSVGSNFSVGQSSVKAGVTISTSSWKEASKAVKEKELEVLDRQGEMKDKFQQVLKALVTPPVSSGKWFLIPVLTILVLLLWAIVGVLIVFGGSIADVMKWLQGKMSAGLRWGIVFPVLIGLVLWFVFEVKNWIHRFRADGGFKDHVFSPRRLARWHSWIVGDEGKEDVQNDNAKGRVVFFIDDLDRCLPDQALALLERIRLFLAVEKSSCVFVLGLDPDAIERIVSSKYTQSESKKPVEVGQAPPVEDQRNHGSLFAEYLEKIIQFSVRLPMPSPENLREYIETIIHNNIPSAVIDIADHEIPSGLHADIDIDTANAIIWDLAEAAEECEASLRRTKRLVNAFTYYHRLALSDGKSRIDDYDVEIMAIVVSLQVLYPDQWDIIHHQGGDRLLTGLFDMQFIIDVDSQIDPPEDNEQEAWQGRRTVGNATPPQPTFSPPAGIIALSERSGLRVAGIVKATRDEEEYLKYFGQYRTLVGRSSPDYTEEDENVGYLFKRLLPNQEYKKAVAERKSELKPLGGLLGVMEKVEVGDDIVLGDELWKILEWNSDKTRVLLLSERILAYAQWDHSGNDVEWEECDLRIRLQREADAYIDPRIYTTVPCQAQETGFSGDRFFLLSKFETSHKFTGCDLECHFDFDQGNIDLFGRRPGASWWLRTKAGRKEACVYGAAERFSRIDMTSGVRPAFWLDISPMLFR